MISLVVAHGKNREIGKDNKLLWHLPNDMKHFKELTTGGTVLMGRNTHDSIGRALPNRRNFVVTSRILTTPYSLDGHNDIVAIPPDHNIGNVIRMWNNVPEELFVIGGAQTYSRFMRFADRIYLTLVDAEFEADTFFPRLDMDEWEITSYRFEYPDRNHKYKQVYIVLDKYKIK